MRSTRRTSTSATGERVRAVYERRKRPILLGIAALVVALGTIQIANLALPAGDEAAGDGPAQSSSAPADSAHPKPTGDSAAAPPAAGAQPPAEAAKPQSSLLAPATGPVAGLDPPVRLEAPPPPAARAGGVPSLGAAMTENLPATNPGPPGGDVTGSFRTGVDTLSDAVEAGEPRALYEMAGRLADPNNPARDLGGAAQLYERAAGKGFAPAQYRLGSMYEKGLGVPKDLRLAKTWYERAADKGNIKAMHNMAVLFAEGAIEGKADYATATQWFRLAAEHGLRDSEYNYAILVARGLGSSPNLVEAYKWFQLAAAQGDRDAAAKRDEVAGRLDAAALEDAKAAVARFQPKQAPIMSNDTTLPAVSWAEARPGGA
jgi:localization factor PodJL